MLEKYTHPDDKQQSRKIFSNRLLSSRVLFALLVVVSLLYLLVELLTDLNDSYVIIFLFAFFIIWLMFVMWLGEKLFPPEEYLERQEVKIRVSFMLKASLLVILSAISAMALIFLALAIELI